MIQRTLLGLFLACVSLLGCGGDDTEETSPGPTPVGELTCFAGESSPSLLEDPDVVGRFPEGPLHGFEIHDLGVMKTGKDGITKEFTFTASKETSAFHVVMVSHTGTFVSLVHAEAPDGTRVIDPVMPSDGDPIADVYYAGFGGPGLSVNRAVPRPRAAAALIPNTPRVKMQPGVWKLRAAAVDLRFDETTEQYANTCLQAAVRVAIVERRTPAPEKGTIDLVLSFAEDSGISASSAESNDTLQAGIDKIDTIFRSAGISVGSVTYRDAPKLASIVDMEGPACLGGADTEHMFDSTEGPVDAVHLLFIDRFKCEARGSDLGPQIAGISNGVPGLPLSTRDGVFVATNHMKDYPEEWALVITHELGHFFGLSHTCEIAGEICDEIPDTAEGEGAARNLMFPNVSRIAKQILTPQQGAVMRLSPVVRP